MTGLVTGETNSDVTETDKVEGTSAVAADVKVTSAESSPAEPKSEKVDLLTAVKAALKPPTEKSLDSKTPGSETAEGAETALDKDADKGSETDDLTEEELARLKPKTRKRIENLTAARRERDGRIAELEPKAQQFEKMMTFVQTAKLSTDEVNEGFEVMRLLKHEPLKAWERLKPIFDSLRSMVGEVLPEELQIAVNQGQITEAHARELAITRTKAAVSTAQVQRHEADTREQQQQDAHQKRQVAVQTSVVEWEKSKAGSDPDWKQKQSRVMEIVQLETLRREKADPNFGWTPEEAVKFANEALTKVETEFKRFAPRPKAINPVIDVASTRSEAKPTTALEAAKQGLARMAG